MLKSLFFSKSKSSYELKDEIFFNELRSREFARLEDDNHVYLDYTGGNLYPESLLEKHFKRLKNNTFGNPHSTNPTSLHATHLIEATRAKVLSFFNAEDYYCVFTANASGALKIVGECYPFEDQGRFVLFADNHNSVNGIREYCKNWGAPFQYIPMNYEDLSIAEADLNIALQESLGKQKLFAFPAQSNVSGVKHDLNWIHKAQDKGWDVLLDAAAFVPTSKLDLKAFPADFVSVSFYKIFGFPTGIGCLLVKKDKMKLLKKRWFAGGTVNLASVAAPYHFLHENHEKFENGTLNYLGIPAIKDGLEFIESIGIDRINERVSNLRTYLVDELKTIKYANGQKLIQIFGTEVEDKVGGTIIMSFFDDQGKKLNFEDIEHLANQRKISIRSGCFCNPGLDETNNCLTSEEITQYFTSRDSGDYKDMIQHLNKMRGSTRVSVGIATNQRDLDVFIEFVKSLRNSRKL